MVPARRTGFTLIEMAVGVAIAAILSFALYATIAGPGNSTSAADDRAARAGNAAVVLFDIASAVAALETTNPPVSYLQTVGAYPNALSQLSTPITTADRNSCNRAADRYSGAAVPANPDVPGYVLGWQGPYYTMTFAPGGSTQLAIGFVAQDDMIRIPANPVNNPKAGEWAGVLQVIMPSVSQLDAQALDATVDQTISGTAGTVRYAGGDPTSVAFEIVVSGC